MYPVWVEAVLTATYLINRIPSKFLLEASLITLIKKYLAAVHILFFLFFLKKAKESELNETSEASSKRRSIVEGNEIETQREIRSEIRQKQKEG